MMIPLTFEFHKISEYSLEMTRHRLEEVLSSSRGDKWIPFPKARKQSATSYTPGIR